MEKNLKYYSEITYSILNCETQYLSNKKIIYQLFFESNTSNFRNIINNRIVHIDSYYSTQMSKRLYGIDDLVDELTFYSDEFLKVQTKEFLRNPTEMGIINSLLEKNYGINKSGKPFGKSISLISKYLHFLTSGNFPIYDRLVIDSYKFLEKKNLILTTTSINNVNYFECIKKVNLSTGINNYEKLDNLFWLIGKIRNNSFASLLNKRDYLKLIKIKELDFDLKKNKKTSKSKKR